MSLRAFIQDHPKPLVWAWELTLRVLSWMRPIFARLGLERASKWLRTPEMLIKKPLFDCRECGQCVLHYTGMTCPMTCPKQLRNGPCGGVRANGHCEVYPEKWCVWVKAWERSARTPYRAEMTRLNAPVDWRLEGLSSWVTHALERDAITTGNDPAVHYADEVLEGRSWN